MIDINQLDPAGLATISAIVAALVTVVGNAFKLQKQYRSLLAIGVAFLLVFLPTFLLNKILTALIIGLTASGVYSQVKPMNLLQGNSTKKNKNTRNNTSMPNKTLTNQTPNQPVKQPTKQPTTNNNPENNSTEDDQKQTISALNRK